MTRVAAALAALAIGVAGGAAGEAAVPISIAASGHATVPVAVAGHGTVPFVFDTGAEGSVVYRATAEAWRLPPGAGPVTLIGQTGAAELPLVRLPAVTLDGVTAAALETVVLPSRADGVPLVGIVGLDLFGRRLVDFDLPRRRLALHPTGAARIVPAGLAPVRATRLPSGLLTVPVAIGGREGVAVIDTGARRTRINGRFAALLGIGAGTPGFVAGEPVRGATNVPVSTLDGRVADVRLGAVRLAHAPVLIADLPVFATFGVADRPAMILGLDWFERVRMIVDFPAALAWFVRS